MNSNAETYSNLTFRDMKETDARALCDCIRICYGDTYFVDDFYDPERLSVLINQGLLNSSIAVTTSGKVVGHLGLTLERSDDITADTLAAMVAPDYRGHRILVELGKQLMDTYERLGLVGLQLYAIAVHKIVQGQSTEAGGIETGILLGHFPADIQIEGFSSAYDGSRVAAVLLYFPLHPAPSRTVYVPDRYRDIIDSVYQELGLDRTIERNSTLSFSATTVTSIEEKPRQGTARIRVDRTGVDLMEVIARFKNLSLAKSFPVLYADLPLADPVSAVFINDLRSLGFFYGGIVMERSGSDILRMQYVNRKNVNPEAIVLARPYGKDLLEFVLSDWQ